MEFKRKGKVKYLSVKETAAKWGVTERRVTQLCAGGQIKGAVQTDWGETRKTWLIPSFAKKPGDGRVKTGRYTRRDSSEMDKYVNGLFRTDPISKLRELPAGSVDMIITDLAFMQQDPKHIDALPEMWREYKRVLRDTGVAVVCTRGIHGIEIVADNGGLLKYKFTWVYNNCLTGRERFADPSSVQMDVWVFAKNDAAASLAGRDAEFEGLVHLGANTDRKAFTDVISIKASADTFTREQEILGRLLIRTYTKPGDIVLDNACNFLAFIKAALAEGRNFIGMESRTAKLFEDLGDLDDLMDETSFIEGYEGGLYKVWKSLPADKRAFIRETGEIEEFEEYGDDILLYLTSLENDTYCEGEEYGVAEPEDTDVDMSALMDVLGIEEDDEE